MNDALAPVETYLTMRDKPTFGAYYNGKMSYALHGQAWKTYVTEAFPELNKMATSENVYKSVLDLYAENLVPVPDKLRASATCWCRSCRVGSVWWWWTPLALPTSPSTSRCSATVSSPWRLSTLAAWRP